MKKIFRAFVLVSFLFSCSKIDNTVMPPVPSYFKNELVQRINYLEKLESQNQYTTEIKYILATYYLQNNQLEKCQKYINEVLNNVIPLKKHYLILSECLYKQGKFATSLEAFQKIGINDLTEDEYSLFAIDIFLKAKKYKEVSKIIEVMLKKNPNNIEILNQKTAYLLAMKDTAFAIENLNKILNIDSTQTLSLINITELHYQKGSFTQALENAKKLYFQNKFTKNTLKIISDGYWKEKNKDSFKLYYQKYIQFDSLYQQKILNSN